MKNSEAWSDGPWRVGANGLIPKFPWRVEAVGGDGVCWFAQEANANLIAVAPELVEGIEKLREELSTLAGVFMVEDEGNAYVKARTALDEIFQPLLDRARGVVEEPTK